MEELFYDGNSLGKAISDPKEQDRIREEKSSSFQGFFLADDLRSFFPKPSKPPKPTDCVGIRFYNAGGLTEAEHRLIAIGVTQDGKEVSPGQNLKYRISATKPRLPFDTLNKREATHAVWTAKVARQEKDRDRLSFASFFSEKMINQLLEPKNGQKIDGIRFHIVLGELQFPDGKKGTGFTHLGISSVLVKDHSEPLKGFAGNSHIVSDQTCPKYCVLATLKSESKADRLVSSDTDNPVVYKLADRAIVVNDRYLNVWD